MMKAGGIAMRLTRSIVCVSACAVSGLLISPACSSAEAAGDATAAAVAATPRPAARTGAPADGTVLELGDRFGQPDTLCCEVSYKVKRKNGVLTKTLEVEVDNAAPGTTSSVVLDGVTIGTMTTNAKGD